MRLTISALMLFTMACARPVPVTVPGSASRSTSESAPASATAPADRFVRPEDIVIFPDSGPVLRGQISPIYPPMRPEGEMPAVSLILVYVVDTTGLVEIPTVSFLESPRRSPWEIVPDGFLRSVCDYLRDARFRPATVDGRFQRALVIQSFIFSQTRARPAHDFGPHVKALREMSRTEMFGRLGELPHCHPRRADGFYR